MSLRRGEFGYTATDHEMDGLAPVLRLVRSYRSRVDFVGPFASAWDHNYDVRLHFGTNLAVCENEVEVSFGDLQPIPMRPGGLPIDGFGLVDDYNGDYRTSNQYLPVSAAGANMELIHAELETCPWKLTLPDLSFYCFDAAGYANLFQPPGSDGELRFTWEDATDNRRLERVDRWLGGRNTHRLTFEYFDDESDDDENSCLFPATGSGWIRATALESLVDNNGLTRRVLSKVAYCYTAGGHLASARDTFRTGDTYKYIERNGDDARVPANGLAPFCTGVCSTTQPTGCGAYSYCQQYERDNLTGCSTGCTTGCATTCDARFDAYKSEFISVWEADNGRPCVNDWRPGSSGKSDQCFTNWVDPKLWKRTCVESCAPECSSRCQGPGFLSNLCQHSCESNCLTTATDPKSFVYGKPGDLRSDLLSITDRAGRVLVKNEYGQDPATPSFDAVIKQWQGDSGPLTFEYFDFYPPTPTAPLGAAPPAPGTLDRASGRAPNGLLLTDRFFPVSAIGDSSVASNRPDGRLELCGAATSGPSIQRYFVPTANRDGLMMVKPFQNLTLPQKFLGDPILLERTPAGYYPRSQVLPGTSNVRNVTVALGDLPISLRTSSGDLLSGTPLSGVSTQYLVAGRVFAPTNESIDAERSFPIPMNVAVPQALSIIVGSAGEEAARLTFSGTKGGNVECTYQARGRQGCASNNNDDYASRGQQFVETVGHDDDDERPSDPVSITQEYRLARCSNGARAGENIQAAGMRMQILTGAPKPSPGIVIAYAQVALSAPSAKTLQASLPGSPGELVLAVPQGASGYLPIGVVEGIAGLTMGECNHPFMGSVDSSGRLTASSSACKGDLEVLPILGRSSTSWDAVTRGNSVVRMTQVAPAVWDLKSQGSVRLDVGHWSAVVSRLGQQGLLLAPYTSQAQLSLFLPNLPRNALQVDQTLDSFVGISRALPEDIGGQVAALSNDLRLQVPDLGLRPDFESLPIYETTVRQILERIHLNGILPRGETSAVSADPAFVPVPAACQVAPSFAPPQDRSTEVPLRRARWATRVAGPDDLALISYYNDVGDNLRVVDTKRRIVEDMEFDEAHNRVGYLRHLTTNLDTIGARECTTYSDRHLPELVTRIGGDGQTQRQCFAYDSRGPWLKAASIPDTRQATPQLPGSEAPWLFRKVFDYAGRPTTEVDTEGNVTARVYSILGNLSRLTTPDGTLTRFDGADPATGLPNLVTEDAVGVRRQTTLTYDGFGHATGIDRHGWGINEAWSWLGKNRLDRHTTSWSGGEAATSYRYDASGLTDKVIGPQITTSYVYDGGGRVSKVTVGSNADPTQQRSTCFRRRLDGSLQGVIDQFGAQWTETRSFSSTGIMHSVNVAPATDPNGPAPQIDVAGGIPTGNVLSRLFNSAGQLIRSTDSSGVSIDFEYDSLGRTLSQATNGVGVRTYYNRFGLPVVSLSTANVRNAPNALAASDPSLNLQSLGPIADGLSADFYGYDANLAVSRHERYAKSGSIWTRALQVTSDVNEQARTTKQTNFTDAGTQELLTKVDAVGRVVSVTDGADVAESYSYPTPLTKRIRQKGPDGGTIETVWKYDETFQPLTVSDSSGKSVESFQYDQAGRQTGVTDESGSLQETLRNAFGDVREVIRHEGGPGTPILEQQSFDIDPRGRIRSAQAGGKQVARYRYDLLSRVREEIRPSPATPGAEVTRNITYVGATSKPATQTLPSGRAFSYTYAPTGALSRITADASRVGTLIGATQGTIDLHPGVLGLPETPTITLGSFTSLTTLRYDGIGRRISEQGDSAPTIERAYGTGLPLNRLTIGGRAFEYARRADGRLTSISDIAAARELTRYSYAGAGQAQTMRMGNGVTESRSFDTRGRLLSQSAEAYSLQYGYGTDGATRRIQTSIAGGAPQSTLFQTYPGGQLQSEILNVSASTASLPRGTITNQLLDGYKATATDVRTYQFDAANNWTQVIGSTSPTFQPSPTAAQTYEFSRDGPNKYDVDGRLVQAGEKAFGYDVFGQLAQVRARFLVCNYDYDALGRRILEDCNENGTEFVYDGPNLVAETSPDGAWLTLHEDSVNSPRVRLRGNEAVFLVADKSSSVRAALGDGGSIRERYSYTAFGETKFEALGAPTGNRFGFHGAVYDPDSGLYQMRARYYAPGLGRFISPDPLGVGGGFNLFAFAQNRPADLWDPFGLSAASNRASSGIALSDPVECIGNCHTDATSSELAFTPFVTGPNFNPVIRVEFGPPPGPLPNLSGRGRTVAMLERFGPGTYEQKYNPYEGTGTCNISSGQCEASTPLLGSHGASEIASPTMIAFGDAVNPLGTILDPHASTGQKFLAVATFVPLGRGAKLVEGGVEILNAARISSGAEGVGGQLPKYLYHYTSQGTAQVIEESQFLGREASTLYLTPNGGLSPTQAGIELALPQTNTAGALFRVPTSALNAGQISRIGSVTGNVLGRGGGGIELLYEGRVPLDVVERLR